MITIFKRTLAALTDMSSKPLIVICGTTGVGKSKLGIELALALSGNRQNHPYHGASIINADSMQVYTGMDVITNKVPMAERCSVPHLLMDYKKPGEQLTGPEWIKDAIEAVEETHSRNQVPIIVGGTSYWIQHLIFPERMASLDKSGDESPGSKQVSLPSIAFTNALASLPSELLTLFNNLPGQAPTADIDPQLSLDLHKLLAHIDPLVSQRWHWRDSRKVLTNLRIIQENHRLASEIIKEQSQLSPKPRYRTLCFWLYAKPDVLKPRLDDRVDQMIEQGLLNEIRTLRAIATAGAQSESSSCRNGQPSMLGIYQSIGYKEFHDYLSAPEPSDAAFRVAVEQMKLGTRKYAKRQVAWVRNKLLPVVRAANSRSQAGDGEPIVPTYLLDATELGDAWKTNVHDLGTGITRAFLEGEALPDPLKLSQTASEMLTVRDRPTDPMAVLNANQRVVCPVCTVDPDQPVLVDSTKWEMHHRSRGHRRMTGKDKRSSQYAQLEDMGTGATVNTGGGSLEP